MTHYCIYTRDIVPTVMRELGQLTHTDFEMHFNRTRFWLNPHDRTHMRFYIRWSHVLHDISHENNHQLGT